MTVVTRIEVFQGRFASLLKAEDGAAQFDRLRENRKLKKIGRADMLIAAIVMACRAVLVTRNVRDFRLIPGVSIEN